MDHAALEGSLSSLGLRDLEPIVGGWQSLAVYRARVDGRLVAVKVFDSELVDRDLLDVRLDVLSRLRRTGDVVCGPLPVDGYLVSVVRAATADPAYAVAYEFSSKNMRTANGRWRVFDLDDCGYGPSKLTSPTRCTSFSSMR
jgi:hypothetical protein